MVLHRFWEQGSKRWLRTGLFFLLVALAGLSIAAACGGAPEPELPDATAESLIRYLEEAGYGENWELWPGLGEKYSAKEPHGMLLTTYLNDAALNALMSKEGIMPGGAIIVKENYSSEGEFEANTVMYKKSGYNPEHNDWFWLKVLADGTVEEEGRAEGCQTCHGQVKVNDYVWSGPLF